MTCDDAIEILLEESANGSMQAALETHVQQCGRCNSLVEILSPLFIEKSDREKSESAINEKIEFSFTDPASEEALAVAEETAVKLHHRPVVVSTSHRETFFSKLKFTAAFLAGVAASFGAIAVLRSEPVPHSSMPQTACLWESKFDDQFTASEFVQSCAVCHLEPR